MILIIGICNVISLVKFLKLMKKKIKNKIIGYIKENFSICIFFINNF